ncbi:MAG: hypothetical protein VKI42_08645 [Synechococcaceae cyanobacterium]|nr:hypothetical protein [Synechococcaceae cyanobacterium]
MQKTHNPIEVAIVLAWLVAEALAVLVVAAIALIIALKPCSPGRAASQKRFWVRATELKPCSPGRAGKHFARLPKRPASPSPTATPLAAAAALVASELETSTVAELRRQARAAGLPRSLSRSGRRDALLSTLAGLEVAMI